jgi:hypothetical protein
MKNQNLYKLSFGANFTFESSSLLEIMLYSTSQFATTCNWLLFTIGLIMFTTTKLPPYIFWTIGLCVQLIVYI